MANEFVFTGVDQLTPIITGMSGALAALTNKTLELAKVQTSFGTDQEQLSGKLEILSKSGEKLTAVIRDLGKSKITGEELGLGISSLTFDPQIASAKKLKEQLDAVKTASDQFAKLSLAGPVPPAAQATQAALQNRLAAATISGNIQPARLAEIQQGVEKGVSGPLVGAEAQAQSVLFKIQGYYKSLTDQIQKTTEKTIEFAKGVSIARDVSSKLSTGADLTKATQAQLSAIKTYQQQVTGAVAKGGFTKTDVGRVQADLAKGIVQPGSADLGKLQSGLLGLAGTYDKIRDSAKAAADKVAAFTAATKSTQDVVDKVGKGTDLSKASTSQLNAIRAAQSQVLSGAVKGGFSGADLNKILDDVNKGVISVGSAAQSQVQGGLLNLKKAFDDIAESAKEAGEKGGGAGQKIIITWQGAFRLFQTVVLRTIFRGFIKGVEEAVETMTELSQKIGELKAISGDANTTTEQWYATLRQLSDAFSTPVLDVAAAQYHALASGFVSAGNSAHFLQEALRLSQATTVPVKETITLLIDSLQAFRLTESDVDRATGILFNTIKQGSINVQQYASGIGKVGNVAQSLGISFEDVNTAISLFGQAGLTTGDSLNALSSIFDRLINPSKELKDLFREWNVTSGEMAIKTFGLAGVFQKLGQELEKGGIGRLGDLEKQLRAVRGTLIGTAGGFDEVRKKIADQAKAEEDIEKSRAATRSTPGAQIKESLNKISNTFNTDIGAPVVAVFGAATKALAGFINLLSSLIPIVKQIVIGFAAYLLVTKAIALWNAIVAGSVLSLSVDMGGANVTVLGLTFSLNALSISLRTLLTTLGPIGIAFGVISLALSAFQAQAAVGAGFVLPEKDRTVQEESHKAFTKNINEEQEQFKEAYEERQKIVLNFVTNANRELNEFADSTRKKTDNVTESLRKGFEDVFKKIKSTDQETPDQILRQATTNIKQSQKEVRGAGDQFERRVFESSLKGIESFDAAGATSLSLGFAEKLQGQAIKFFDEKNIEDARSKLKEVDSVLEQILNKQISFREKAAKLGVVFSTPLSQSDAYQALANNTQLRISLEQQYQQQQKETVKNAAIAIQAQTALLKEQQTIENNLEEISRRRLANDSALESAHRGIAEATNEQAAALAQIEAFFKAEGSRLNLFSGSGKAIAGTGILDKNIAAAKQAQEELKAIPVGGEGREAAAAKASEALERVRQSFKNLYVKPGTDEDTASRILENATINGQKASDVFDKAGKASNNLLDSLKKFNELKTEKGNIAEAFGSLGNSVDKLKASFGGLPEAIAPAKTSMVDLVAQIDKAVLRVEDLRRALQGINQGGTGGIQVAPSGVQVAPSPIQAAPSGGGIAPSSEPEFWMGGMVEGYKMGGMAWKKFQEGGDTDTIPAMLSPGEFVMNADSTGKFYPQLKAMNSGNFDPSSLGGTNTANFGDINITVNGGNDSKETVRDMAMQLRRELRRGNISFE